MSLQTLGRNPALAASWLLLAALGCADATAPSQPARWEPQASSRAGLVCADVDLEGTGQLGIIPAGLEGAGSLGAIPAPTTFAGVSGMLHSYITSDMTPVGANAQGTAHITLTHVFNSASGSFHTSDQATCGPIPGSPGTCRLSDQMTIVSGDGVFAGAAGKLHNRGVLDFNAFMLEFHATGTVCGEGL